MTKEVKNYIQKHYPEKADRIIRYALPENKLTDAGIIPLKNEVFVQYPEWPDYYGSNHGRLVSIKGKRIKKLNPTPSPAGYEMYCMNHPDKTKTISANRLIADLFLPDYWPELRYGLKECHHMNHIRNDNRIENLLFLTSKLHNLINHVDTVWFSPGNGKPFKKTHPYDIMRKTGLSLEQIIIVLKEAKPDVVTWQDGTKIDVYDVCGHMIGYTMCPNYDVED